MAVQPVMLVTLQSGFSLTDILILTGVSIAVLIWDIVALVIIRRTKRIPVVARFLSMALIIFEAFALICFTVRKFMWDPFVIVFGATGMQFWVLSFITIGLMSVERLVFFSSTRIYLQYAHFNFIRKVSFGLWSGTTCIYLVARFGVCALVSDSYECGTMVINVIGGLVFLIILFSVACFVKVHLLIKEMRSFYHLQEVSSAKGPVRYITALRTTRLVGSFLFVSVVGMLVFAKREFLKTSDKELALESDIMIILNCFIDPLVHIFCFKECRLELLKLFGITISSTRKAPYTVDDTSSRCDGSSSETTQRTTLSTAGSK